MDWAQPSSRCHAPNRLPNPTANFTPGSFEKLREASRKRIIIPFLFAFLPSFLFSSSLLFHCVLHLFFIYSSFIPDEWIECISFIFVAVGQMRVLGWVLFVFQWALRPDSGAVVGQRCQISHLISRCRWISSQFAVQSWNGFAPGWAPICKWGGPMVR